MVNADRNASFVNFLIKFNSEIKCIIRKIEKLNNKQIVAKYGVLFNNNICIIIIIIRIQGQPKDHKEEGPPRKGAL